MADFFDGNNNGEHLPMTVSAPLQIKALQEIITVEIDRSRSKSKHINKMMQVLIKKNQEVQLEAEASYTFLNTKLEHLMQFTPDAGNKSNHSDSPVVDSSPSRPTPVVDLPPSRPILVVDMPPSRPTPVVGLPPSRPILVADMPPSRPTPVGVRLSDSLFQPGGLDEHRIPTSVASADNTPHKPRIPDSSSDPDVPRRTPADHSSGTSANTDPSSGTSATTDPLNTPDMQRRVAAALKARGVPEDYRVRLDFDEV